MFLLQYIKICQNNYRKIVGKLKFLYRSLHTIIREIVSKFVVI